MIVLGKCHLYSMDQPGRPLESGYNPTSNPGNWMEKSLRHLRWWPEMLNVLGIGRMINSI